MSGYTTPQTRLTIAALTGLANARSAHSLAAGLAIGSNVWGSLIQGVIAYKNLPRQVRGDGSDLIFGYCMANVAPHDVHSAIWQSTSQDFPSVR